jgi:hypothetical protein
MVECSGTSAGVPSACSLVRWLVHCVSCTHIVGTCHNTCNQRWHVRHTAGHSCTELRHRLLAYCAKQQVMAASCSADRYGLGLAHICCLRKRTACVAVSGHPQAPVTMCGCMCELHPLCSLQIRFLFVVLTSAAIPPFGQLHE